MDQAANSIRKEHVDLLRLNHGRYFTGAVGWMGQVLSRAIGTRAIVRSARFSAGAGRASTRGWFERTAHATLRTADSRDLAALRNRGDNVAALLLAASAELIYTVANSVRRFFHLWRFDWHQKQARGAGDLTQHKRAPS